MINKNDLLKELDSKGIGYNKYEHDALYTVEDSETKRGDIVGAHTKNLFLKNKKGFFCLLTCEESSLVNLKQFSKSIEAGNLSFANEEYLLKYMAITPGSVSPYGLLNDYDNKIVFYLEEGLYNSEKINFHPLLNTSTITTTTKDFINFMIEKKKKINIFSLEEYKVIKEI